MSSIEHRRLGTGGPRVPVLGFGAWPIGGGLGAVDRGTAIATVRAAIDSGITLIDTAEGYRTSEALIGEALEGGYRERCFLATKASFDFTPRGLRAALENSLRALNVDFVDLYQLHNFDPGVPVEQSLAELQKLKDEGKIRLIGVSNFLPDHLERALKVCAVSSNQVRYSMFFREIEQATVDFCERHGIGILVHSPLAKGLLTGRSTPESRFPADDERAGFPDFTGPRFARHLARAGRLSQVARDKGISLVQLAIAWTLRLPAVSCTLVGAKNAHQLSEHVGAAAVRLTAPELERIEAILRE
ncbi:MAG TPA: aldo/keto reductase [Spirochaetia bacterium]|nr:aldo/keto reductase [Spirochaetia bacterium]